MGKGSDCINQGVIVGPCDLDRGSDPALVQDMNVPGKGEEAASRTAKFVEEALKGMGPTLGCGSNRHFDGGVFAGGWGKSRGLVPKTAGRGKTPVGQD